MDVSLKPVRGEQGDLAGILLTQQSEIDNAKGKYRTTVCMERTFGRVHQVVGDISLMAHFMTNTLNPTEGQ